MASEAVKAESEEEKAIWLAGLSHLCGLAAICAVKCLMCQLREGILCEMKLSLPALLQNICYPVISEKMCYLSFSIHMKVVSMTLCMWPEMK